ncbi:ATP-binding protein [Lacicoccus alkaliphilus]|uniref:Uncharacterized protein YhaN n=1 Tax=Lacicoccus alkaliphilus DSM 16010 TaxID=1123231 RepID=A0A1M7A8D8_9BACL|nr:AAA family ATPase [Salinicoccus alkaliphilus]SHL38888.1 Uncharacterized protein YhaN [Salinicoccus alkaliphilus DSM 16010]
MKILSLNIYGYGKIAETEIKTPHQFVQIFGENEAGKSTMQSFIHSVLFGFPTRKEAEPRREPRMHNMYGGKLTVDFEDGGGPVEIERVKGNRVQGDVKIYLDDGSSRSEEWLIRKMNFIDKRTYRSIFSFDVLGLQDIHKNMTEDKLQEYLLRAGALGSHEYDEMLSAIDQELKDLYKKNGINPKINQELVELREINEKIRKLEAEESNYNHLTTEQMKYEESLNAKRDALNQLDTVRKQKMKEIMYHKDIKDWKALEGVLNVAPPVFPEKGIERYESLKNGYEQAGKDIDLRLEKLKSLKGEINRIELPETKDIECLESLKAREPDIKQKNLEITRLNHAIENLEDEIVQLQKDIGWQDEHLEVDDSNIIRESVQSLLAKLDEVTLEEQYLVREIDHIKSDIRQLDQEITALEEAQISDARIRTKKEVLDKEIELKEKGKMFQLIEKEYEREKRERNRSKRNQTTLILGISVVTLVIGIIYFINSAPGMGTVFTVIGAAALLILLLTNREEEENLRTDYEREVAALKDEIEQIKQGNDVDFDLNDARDLKMDLRTQKSKRISFNVKIEELKETLAMKETEHDRLNTDLLEMKRKLKINPEIENKYIVDAIYTIREIKQKRNQISRHSVEKDNIIRSLQDFKREVKEDVSKFGITYNDSAIFYDVNAKLTELNENIANHDHLTDQIKLLENEISVMEERVASAVREINALFDQADAENEDDYYYRARRFEEYQDNLDRFKALSAKLDEELFDYDMRNDLASLMLADLKEEEAGINRQIERFNALVQDEQKVLAEINKEIDVLESDGKLSELNHEYEMRKSLIQGLSEDYLSLKYIQLLIETHIKAIKDERLPIVIEEARSIFEFVTRGRYINVIYDEQGITVRHSNGQLFHPLELSQSTKEMLYISLRLSLIKALQGYYQLPLIIDDAFVHFDKERKKIIMDYLRSEVKDQVLYFTCNLDTAIPSNQTIRLKEKVK